jgi:hypothetical protein
MRAGLVIARAPAMPMNGQPWLPFTLLEILRDGSEFRAVQPRLAPASGHAGLMMRRVS